MSNSKAADVTGAAAEPTDNPPGPPNVGSPAVGEQPDGADGKQEREHWIHKAPKFIEAACAIALVLITGTYTKYAGDQLTEMKESVRQQGDAIMLTGGQLTVASRTAEVAKKANELADTNARQSLISAHLDQRAWLSPGFFSVDREPIAIDKATNTNDFSMGFTLNNSGKTPALRVHGLLHQDLSRSIPKQPDWEATFKADRQIAKIPRIGPRASNLMQKYSVVFPGQSTQLLKSSAMGIDPGTGEQYRKHERVMYLWAKVWYCDVFNRRHWFQLCVFHIYPDSVNPSGFSYCPFGNETDEGKGETQKQECSAQ